MVKILENIWIMTTTGSVIYHRKYDPIIDEQLFGAIISSLNTFAEKGLFEDSISSFVISDKILYLKKKNNILFVTDTSEKKKEKKLIKELDKVIEKFFNLFPPNIFINWDGEINQFESFEKEIEESLKEYD
ncbi:MAG: hypothetical protein ACFFAQ_06625 [Promethearchaeota archaeon]